MRPGCPQGSCRGRRRLLGWPPCRARYRDSRSQRALSGSDVTRTLGGTLIIPGRKVARMQMRVRRAAGAIMLGATLVAGSAAGAGASDDPLSGLDATLRQTAAEI